MVPLILDISIQSFMLFFIASWNLFLGIFIFLKNRKEKANIYLSLMAFSTAVWTVGLVLFQLTTNINSALTFAKIYYIAAALIGFTFLSFSFAFPFRKNLPSFFYRILFYLFTLVVLLITVLPGVMIKKIELLSWGKNAVLGGPYFIYVSYFTMCSVGAFGNFIQKYKIAQGIQKIQIKYVFWGIILAAIWGTIFNLYLPAVGIYRLIWLGPYFTLVMIGFFTYSILKHRLMNIKVIATEMFGILVSIFLLIDAFLSKSVAEFVLKLGLFIAVAFFNYLLIRSVMAEIKAKERITEISGELRNANIKLQKLDQAKSDFLSVTSHQLRTPMTVIKGYVSLMQEGEFGETNDKVKDAMSRIYVSNERLIKLLNDLLDLSRIERGKMNYNFEKYSFAKVAEDAIKELKPVAEQKELKLSYKEPKEYLPEILLDKEYIRQVVTNLLDNAIKYTNNGGKEIEVSFSSTPEKIILQIKDTGKGITPKRMEQLFKRYERGGNEKKFATHAKGLGLGLYVAKMIIDDHKGRIWAESEGEGKGSTFFVELPIG